MLTFSRKLGAYTRINRGEVAVNRCLVWAVAVGLVAGLGTASAGFVVPVQFTIGQTGTTDVPISVTGLHPPALSAYDLELFFNPTALSVSNVAYGDPVHGDQLDLEGLGTFQIWQVIAPGDLHIAEVSQDSASVLTAQQLPSFVIATATFSGPQGTQGNLSLQVNQAGDANGNPIVWVPEPSTWLLAGLSLIALLWHQRRKQAAGAEPFSAEPHEPTRH